MPAPSSVCLLASRIRWLLAAGADVNAKTTTHDATALSWAAMNGRLAVVRALLDAGADVKRCADHGMTALMWAPQNGHLTVVEALLAANAEINAKAADGATALTVASQKGHREVVQFLNALLSSRLTSDR